MNPTSAVYIWHGSDNTGRNLFGRFRKQVVLTDVPTSATINVFADTSYQLFINGAFVEFGPARFDPRFPLHDAIPIASFLRKGKNAIAISVNHDGMKNFKSIPSQAGLIAWGEIHGADGQVIRLDTDAMGWKATRCGAHAGYAPKLSFILNASERFDQAGEEAGWKDADFDDSHWGQAVAVAAQDAWGGLQPREFPQMSKAPEPIPAARVQPLMDHCDRFTFTVDLPHYYEPGNNAIGVRNPDRALQKYSNFLVFSSWIHSPADQVVHAGVYWGDWGCHGKAWLNGKALPAGNDPRTRSMYLVQTWRLQKGWNRYFGCIDLYSDLLCQSFEVAKSAGLTFHADRMPGSAPAFKRSPLVTPAQFETLLKSKPMPYDPAEELAEVGGWILAANAVDTSSPCLDTSWDRYGDGIETVAAGALDGFVAHAADYPHGFSLLFDLGWVHLVLPVLRLSGTDGAVIDVTFSDSLAPDQEHLAHTHYNAIGDRITCAGEGIEWMPPQPRGGRYLRLTFRGNRQDITVASFRLLSANYPVIEHGRFTCSEPLFNAIWTAGKRTQHVCMEDAYIDCAGRERGMYIRDSVIQYRVNQAVFGDHALMRRCLQLFGQSPDHTGKFRAVYPTLGDYTIADFSMNLVEGYDEYCTLTGDTATVARDWQAIRSNMRWFHDLADERRDLLLDADWAKRRGYDSIYGGFHGDLAGGMDRTGVNCHFSCMYLGALESMIRLGERIGADEDVAECHRRVAILKRSIPLAFWDPDQQCYADNLTHATHSIHASLMAVRYGAALPGQIAGIKDHLRKEMTNVFANGYDAADGVLFSPSFAFYLIEALYQLGMHQVAERMICQGWGWGLSQGLKTIPEYFHLRASLCHAWAACPTYYLSRYLLGIHFPKAPDMSVVGIDIRTDAITSASGAYPHPHGGVIEISWHMENGKRVFDVVRAPDGVEVVLPTTFVGAGHSADAVADAVAAPIAAGGSRGSASGVLIPAQHL